MIYRIFDLKKIIFFEPQYTHFALTIFHKKKIVKSKRGGSVLLTYLIIALVLKLKGSLLRTTIRP